MFQMLKALKNIKDVGVSKYANKVGMIYPASFSHQFATVMKKM